MDALNPNIPLEPPVEWFTPPTEMRKDAGCIVEANGRVYGYLCHWGSVLMDGGNDRWKPPRSKHGYAYAHTGDTVCSDGTIVKTANLGGDAGHAKLGQNIEAIQDFYENTQTQLARIRYGEDENGVWFAGACWPTVTDLDIAKMRASARSGHWAVVGDWKDLASGRQGYELVGACLVNVPGLKYARADRAASGVLMINPIAMASGADHDGAMVALFLDAATAAKLAVEGGEEPNALHITLAYFEDAAADRDDWQDLHDHIAAASKRHLPLEGKIAGKGQFYTDEGGVVHWAAPDIPGLNALREEIVTRADLNGFAVRKDHGFTPHITLRYDDDDKMDAPTVDTHDIKFDKLTLAVGGDMTKLSTEARKTVDRVAAQGTIELLQLAAGETAAPGVAVGGVLVVEGSPTEDGRLIPEGAAEWRELPLPLYSSLANLPGHDSAALVGTIDEISRGDDPKVLSWKGTISPDLSDGAGQQTIEAIVAGALRGISIDGIVGPEDYIIEGDGTQVMTRIVIAGATLTPMPAIKEASVTLLSGQTEALMAQDETTLADGEDVTVEEVVADENADADQLSAINDKLDTILEGQAAIQAALDNAQLSARYDAADRKIRRAESK